MKPTARWWAMAVKRPGDVGVDVGKGIQSKMKLPLNTPLQEERNSREIKKTTARLKTLFSVNLSGLLFCNDLAIQSW